VLALLVLLTFHAGSALGYQERSQEAKITQSSPDESALAKPEQQLAALSKPATTTANGDTTARPVYVPPRRGAPATRVGGGTRSGGVNAPQIALLSPEHTGLTQQATPTLYWYLSRDYTGVIEFVVTGRHSITPALRLRSDGHQAAGIHALDLAAHDVALEPGTLYQWSVSIVRDENHRSRDVVSVATIERLPAEVGRPDDETVGLAAAGIWYDAVDVASRSGARSARAALLEQVGLADAAAWDRAL